MEMWQDTSTKYELKSWKKNKNRRMILYEDTQQLLFIAILDYRI
jgi:hypothetical protein